MIIKCGFLGKDTLALTIWPVIFVNKKYPITQLTVRHETIHLKQQAEMLFVFFYLWYFIEWMVKGFNYMAISFEKEAYANENDLNYKRKHYAFLKYL